jgi:hypothetical protein
MVQLYCIDYLAGDVGPYKETFEVFRIQQKNIDGRLPPKVNDNQYFVRRVSVSTEKPMQFGIEVWGYPKKLGLTEYSEAEGDVTFRFSDDEGKPAFSGCCQKGLSLEASHFPENKFEFVTPYELRRSHAGVINSGDFASRAFNKSIDAFEIDPSTALGAELRSIKFEPMLWWVCRNMQAVGFMADIPGATAAPQAQKPQANRPTAVRGKNRTSGRA